MRTLSRLPICQDEHGLAVVLGHEVAHATKAIVVGALALGTQFLLLLPYSRDHETEADEIGLRFAIRAGYDPNAAPALWERMAAQGDAGPEFLSTHPNPANRAARLRELIPRLVVEEAARAAQPAVR